jgi:hypothetical protein
VRGKTGDNRARWLRLARALTLATLTFSLGACAVIEGAAGWVSGLFERATPAPSVTLALATPTQTASATLEPSLTADEATSTPTAPTPTQTVTATPSPSRTPTATLAMLSGPAATLLAQQTLSYTPPPRDVDATPVSGQPIGTIATRGPGQPASTWTPRPVEPLATATSPATVAPTGSVALATPSRTSTP